MKPMSPRRGLAAGRVTLTNGRIGGTYLHGAPVLLLTVVGRKTGRHLTVPLTYLRDGERLVVAASRAGFDQHTIPVVVLSPR